MEFLPLTPLLISRMAPPPPLPPMPPFVRLVHLREVRSKNTYEAGENIWVLLCCAMLYLVSVEEQARRLSVSLTV